MGWATWALALTQSGQNRWKEAGVGWKHVRKTGKGLTLNVREEPTERRGLE